MRQAGEGLAGVEAVLQGHDDHVQRLLDQRRHAGLEVRLPVEALLQERLEHLAEVGLQEQKVVRQLQLGVLRVPVGEHCGRRVLRLPLHHVVPSREDVQCSS